MKEDTVSTTPDFAAVRRKLETAPDGQAYWQSLEELSADPAFQDYLEKEFPSQRFRFKGDGASRRDFLRLMGASLAVGGLGACTKQPEEKIVPFSAQPESRIPGKPEFFATSMPLGGDTLSLVVESHGGRPTKVDQNTLHPSGSRGTTNFAQASVLDLYDPDRSRMPIKGGRPSSWEGFSADLGKALAACPEGEGFAILSQEVLSPSMQRQLDAIAAAHPKARLHRWQPLHRDNSRRGAELAFGSDHASRYDIAQADVVVSLDSNFLDAGPGNLALVRGFTQRRKVRRDSTSMNRLYVVESTATNTGACADHRWGMSSAEVEDFARALGSKLGVAGASGAGNSAVDAIAKDLNASKGKSLVLVGESMPPEIHALGHAINAQLGNVGKTISYTRPVEERPAAGCPTMTESITALCEELNSGAVHTLLMLGGNPSFDAPADLGFHDAMRKARFVAHLSAYENETSRYCHWHLPESHYLESWGDSRSADGTLSLIQPLIAPLYETRSATEVLAMVAGDATPGHDIVRASVQQDWEAAGSEAGDFDTAWLTSLHRGFVDGTAFPDASPTLRSSISFARSSAPPSGTELAFRADPCLWDGRFANNGWLQELPRPLLLVTWDNCAYVSVDMAESKGWKKGDIVEITVAGKSVRAPVWPTAGQPDGVILLHFGGGRRAAGRVGNGVGFDPYVLRRAGSAWTTGAIVAATGESMLVAGVQEHGGMEGRDIVRETSFPSDRSDLVTALEKSNPLWHDPDDEHEHAAHHPPDSLSLYPSRNETDGGEYQWGMSIDLSTCVGCNACVASCVAENNIPIVGKDEVANGRELHWLRIDRYYVGDLRNPTVRFQPVACQHCEQAPCEVVCPVGATTHSPEGINEMTYNRCVGTRYCSNNCPYKVRRFNFFRYADFTTESLKLGRNPDVSVRHRGVMEKCTYCVQRVNQARIASKVEGRRIREEEVQTACQTACPADCIVFGDISDPNTAVAKVKQEPHDYRLLDEVGTAPRTSYLAKVTNPNSELSSSS